MSAASDADRWADMDMAAEQSAEDNLRQSWLLLSDLNVSLRALDSERVFVHCRRELEDIAQVVAREGSLASVSLAQARPMLATGLTPPPDPLGTAQKVTLQLLDRVWYGADEYRGLLDALPAIQRLDHRLRALEHERLARRPELLA
jgi:hypothetical protein